MVEPLITDLHVVTPSLGKIQSFAKVSLYIDITFELIMQFLDCFWFIMFLQWEQVVKILAT